MDDFVHEPLDLSKPTIRLLRLLKGEHSPIQCEIFHTRLDEKSKRVAYEALSYVWGSAELNHEVFVAGRRLRITENLHVALVQLRSQVFDRTI